MQQRMDDAQTAGFCLGPPKDTARAAVLLLHGFTGSPWEVRLLGEALAARGYHVLAPRLPGHGTTPEAMLYAGAREWLAAAEAALRSLSGARVVTVVGMSMGGLLGLRLAARHPLVQALVLLAPAVGLREPEARALRRARWLPVFDLAPRWVVKKGVDLEDDAARAEAPLLPRYPLARAFDLFRLMDDAWRDVPRVRCPSLLLVGRNDHVVDPRAVERLARQLPLSRLVTLQRGFHLLARDTDRARVATEVAQFLDATTGA